MAEKLTKQQLKKRQLELNDNLFSLKNLHKITYEHAVEVGAKYYWSDDPCKHGHVGFWYIYYHQDTGKVFKRQCRRCKQLSKQKRISDKGHPYYSKLDKKPLADRMLEDIKLKKLEEQYDDMYWEDLDK